MDTIALRYGEWARDRRVSLTSLLAIAAFLGSLFINFYAIQFATKHASNSVTDIILSNIPTFNVSWFFVYGLWLLVAFITLLCLHHPKRIPFTLFALAMHHLRDLIVEDEERLAKALKKGLELKGYAVDWLPDPKKRSTAYSCTATSTTSLSSTSCSRAWTAPPLPSVCAGEGVTTPIIILTARNETEHKVDLLNKGADDYIVKPFRLRSCSRASTRCLRRPAQSKPVTLLKWARSRWTWPPAWCAKEARKYR
jgi:CheY-like chemotaxis protein